MLNRPMTNTVFLWINVFNCITENESIFKRKCTIVLRLNINSLRVFDIQMSAQNEGVRVREV